MEKGKEKTKIEFVIDTNILISALIPKKQNSETFYEVLTIEDLIKMK